MNETDLAHLRRCVVLATEALAQGDQPFGSVLVGRDGRVLFENRNQIASGDHTRHPEFEIARWSAVNLSADERAAATVYTSGEHCPMCAAAHGLVGLGRIVYASSTGQYGGWLREFGAAPASVRPLSIREVVPDAVVEGPVADLAAEIRALHARYFGKDVPAPR